MPDREYTTDALDARFFAPLRRTRTQRIGVELEFPIWNLQPGAATDFSQHGHAVTGMGINPRWRENRPEPIGNGRYRMLLHHYGAL